MPPGATTVRPTVAGTGVLIGGLRGTPAIQSLEQSLFNASRPSSLAARWESELVMEAGEPVPRLVFGAVPSFQEAKEATVELKETLDELYPFSLESSELETSLIPGLSLPLNTEERENRSRLIWERRTSNPGPEHALQAFRLLRNNPKVQTVVASIASDPTVYNAMIENPEVKQFILENRTSSDTIEDEANVTQVGESGAGDMGKLRNLKDSVIRMVTNIPINLPNLFGSSAADGATSGSDHKENTQSAPKGGKSASGFVEKLRSLKNSVVEMAAHIPNYLPNVFGSSAAETVSGSDHKGNTQSSPTDWNLGTSLIGLAVMVIMVVVFKRV